MSSKLRTAKDRLYGWIRRNKLVTGIAIVMIIILAIMSVSRLLSLRSVIDISSINPLLHSGSNSLVASEDTRKLVLVADDGSTNTSSDSGSSQTDSTKTDNKSNNSSSGNSSSGGGSGSQGGGSTSTPPPDTTPSQPSTRKYPSINNQVNVSIKLPSALNGCSVSYTITPTIKSNGYSGGFTVGMTINHSYTSNGKTKHESEDLLQQSNNFDSGGSKDVKFSYSNTVSNNDSYTAQIFLWPTEAGSDSITIILPKPGSCGVIGIGGGL